MPTHLSGEHLNCHILHRIGALIMPGAFVLAIAPVKPTVAVALSVPTYPVVVAHVEARQYIRASR